jgi:hypothetical protein
VKFVFSSTVSFLLLFRFDCNEGCIVCMNFACASLIFIRIKDNYQDEHYVELIIIHMQTIKGIFMFDFAC